jgi:MFS family permease
LDRRALAVIIASFSTVFVSFAIRYSYGVLLPEMLPSLAISNAEAGVIIASYFVAYTIFSPLLGSLADRYNVRVFLTVFPVLLGAGTLLMSYSSSLANASLFFLLAGIGAASCWAPVMALAQRWVSDKRRGLALAVIDLGSSLGIVGCGSVIPLIVEAYSWRLAWVSLGALAFLIAGSNAFLVRAYPAEQSRLRQLTLGSNTSGLTRITYKGLLRSLRFWLIALSYMFVGFSIIIPLTFLSTYAVQELMLPYETGARLILVIGISAMVGKLVLGPLSDKMGRVKVMMLCSILIAVGCLGIGYNQGFLTLILFTVIFGFGYGAVWSIYAASASDFFSKDSAGSIIGLWILYLGIGFIASPIIAGWIGDMTGTLTWSFILAASSALISLFLLVLVWKRPHG